MAAIDDLNTALAGLSTAVASAVAEINAELAAIQGVTNNDPAITAAAANIGNLTTSLNNAVTAAQTALNPAPAST